MGLDPSFAEAKLIEARARVREHYELESGPALALVPYGLRPGHKFADVELDRLAWLVGRPGRTTGQRVGDLGAEDHLLFYPSSRLHLNLFVGVKAQRSVFIAEPMAVHGGQLKLLALTQRRYFRILTCHRQFLPRLGNGVFYPFGSTWVHDWKQVDRSKSHMLSLIASERRILQGHRLRHEVAAWMQAQPIDADTMGRGYKPFEKKSDGLAPYRYSVVIENVREPDYFSEKLIDAMLCDTVPIYWGCTNIEEYFDTAGMMICTSMEEIQQAVQSVSVKDYQARLAVIEANRRRAAVFAPFEENGAMLLLAEVLRASGSSSKSA